MRSYDRAPRCRVTQISLTCKAWQGVERERPHRPEQLRLVPNDFKTSYVTWILRDTSRLREVQILGDESQSTSGKVWECLSGLLIQLSVNAPALQSLDIVSPRDVWEGDSPQVGLFLPLIVALGQLETLVLKGWRYSRADIDTITYLTRLQNLKVAIPAHESSNTDALQSFVSLLHVLWISMLFFLR